MIGFTDGEKERKRYDRHEGEWILITKPNGNLVPGRVEKIDYENGSLYLNPLVFESHNSKGD